MGFTHHLCATDLSDSYIFYSPHEVLRQWNNIKVLSLIILPSFEYIGVNISGVLSKFSICSLVRQKTTNHPKQNSKRIQKPMQNRDRLFYFKLANSTAAFLNPMRKGLLKLGNCKAKVMCILQNKMLSDFYRHLFMLNLVLLKGINVKICC